MLSAPSKSTYHYSLAKKGFNEQIEGLIDFFNAKGIFHHEFVSEGQKIAGAFFMEVL